MFCALRNFGNGKDRIYSHHFISCDYLANNSLLYLCGKLAELLMLEVGDLHLPQDIYVICC